MSFSSSFSSICPIRRPRRIRPTTIIILCRDARHHDLLLGGQSRFARECRVKGLLFFYFFLSFSLLTPLFSGLTRSWNTVQESRYRLHVFCLPARSNVRLSLSSLSSLVRLSSYVIGIIAQTSLLALKCDLRDDPAVKERLKRYGTHSVQYEEGLAVARRIRASRYLGAFLIPLSEKVES